MGRKSSQKGKDKKMKRKEENAKLAASQALVDAANALADPMSMLQPFKKFDRNGLTLNISCHRVGDLDKDTVDWMFQLTKANMQSLYENSEWGWSDKSKLEEMTEGNAWYLVVRTAENKPVAMVHFRFDMDEDDEVLYCYEIQLCKEVRRKGLGKFLMQILELLAHKMQMKKLMLTVFKHNPDAREFFMNKLKFTVDETSPEETMVEAMFDEEGYTYQILSKTMAPRKPLGTATPVAQTNGHMAAAKS